MTVGHFERCLTDEERKRRREGRREGRGGGRTCIPCLVLIHVVLPVWES